MVLLAVAVAVAAAGAGAGGGGFPKSKISWNILLKDLLSVFELDSASDCGVP